MKDTFCDSCQAQLCGCKATEKDNVKNEKDEIISCKLYMKRVRPGVCIDCESGGRL